jgi:hypothetical protein
LIKAKINGVAGNFILDTGASNSCIGFESIELFKVQAQDSKTMAAGRCYRNADSNSYQQSLQLGYWKDTDFLSYFRSFACKQSFTFTQEQTCTWNNWSKYFDERKSNYRLLQSVFILTKIKNHK